MSTNPCGSVKIDGGWPLYCTKDKGHDYGHSWEGATREEIRALIREELVRLKVIANKGDVCILLRTR